MRQSKKKRSRTAIFSVNGAQKHWSNTHQITSKKEPVIDKKVSIEKLSEEFKPVALENYEFEDRRNKNIKKILLHFRIIKIPIEKTQSEIILSKKHLKKTLSIQTFIEEFTFVVFEKGEYRDILIAKALLPLLVNQDSNSVVEIKSHDI